MKVEIRANGRLEFRISKPEGPVQAAAMAEFQRAVTNSQKVSVVATDDGLVLTVVEG